jgi:hypothetical protein
MQTVLMMDDIDLIIVIVSDTLEDILQCSEAKQETMYERIEADLKGVQQALYSIVQCLLTPPSSEGTELGDEPAQLPNSRCDRSSPSSCSGRKRTGHRGLKARKRGSHRETSGCATEKDDIQAKFAEDRVQI